MPRVLPHQTFPGSSLGHHCTGVPSRVEPSTGLLPDQPTPSVPAALLQPPPHFSVSLQLLTSQHSNRKTLSPQSDSALLRLTDPPGFPLTETEDLPWPSRAPLPPISSPYSFQPQGLAHLEQQGQRPTWRVEMERVPGAAP